ncbi:MAG: ABC-three component system middle component 6 [Stenotrophomonas sp.]|uniref:ABC-three component system middle component 6 n=1 Tax=Stenotrophomonas sp. TaxID=69392 RepID=UPI003D6CBDF8
MLLPDNIHPESTAVYNGALIVKALRKIGGASLMDLYVEARNESKMTMPLFVLSLDWLYLVDCVKLDELGNVSLCS